MFGANTSSSIWQKPRVRGALSLRSPYGIAAPVQVHRCFAGFRVLASAIALLPLLVASTRVAHAQTAVQWIATAGGNGHWYQRVTGPSEVNWLEADSAARAAGGHLVTVNSAEEAGSSSRLILAFSTSRFLQSLRFLRLQIALGVTQALEHLLPHAEMLQRLRHRPTRLTGDCRLHAGWYDLPIRMRLVRSIERLRSSGGAGGTRHADGSEFGI